MPATRRITTTVLPGGRIEVEAPGLLAGQSVDVLVLPRSSKAQRKSFWEFLQALPSRRTLKEWEQFERHFQAERDSWDRYV